LILIFLYVILYNKKKLAVFGRGSPAAQPWGAARDSLFTGCGPPEAPTFGGGWAKPKGFRGQGPHGLRWGFGEGPRGVRTSPTGEGDTSKEVSKRTLLGVPYSYILIFLYSYILIFLYSYILIFLYSYILIFLCHEGSF
jgi:hypothetical protein